MDIPKPEMGFMLTRLRWQKKTESWPILLSGVNGITASWTMTHLMQHRHSWDTWRWITSTHSYEEDCREAQTWKCLSDVQKAREWKGGRESVDRPVLSDSLTITAVMTIAAHDMSCKPILIPPINVSLQVKGSYMNTLCQSLNSLDDFGDSCLCFSRCFEVKEAQLTKEFLCAC